LRSSRTSMAKALNGSIKSMQRRHLSLHFRALRHWQPEVDLDGYLSSRIGILADEQGIEIYKLLEGSTNIPAALTWQKIQHYAGGNVKKAPGEYLDWIFRRLGTSLKEVLAAHPGAEAVSSRSYIRRYVVSNEYLQMRIKELLKARDLPVSHLLRNRENIPPGLTWQKIAHYMSGQTGVISSVYLAYVFQILGSSLESELATCPGDDILCVNYLEEWGMRLTLYLRGQMEILLDERNTNPLLLLGGRADAPYGLTPRKFREYLDGDVKFVPRTHIEYIFIHLGSSLDEAFDDAPDPVLEEDPGSFDDDADLLDFSLDIEWDFKL
jgi:hypothetical protein